MCGNQFWYNITYEPALCRCLRIYVDSIKNKSQYQIQKINYIHDHQILGTITQ